MMSSLLRGFQIREFFGPLPYYLLTLLGRSILWDLNPTGTSSIAPPDMLDRPATPGSYRPDYRFPGFTQRDLLSLFRKEYSLFPKYRRRVIGTGSPLSDPLTRTASIWAVQPNKGPVSPDSIDSWKLRCFPEPTHTCCLVFVRHRSHDPL